MALILVDEEADLETFAELDNVDYHDRVVGIIGAAFIDDRLTARIKARLRPHKSLVKQYFGQSGAFGSLGLKIDLGFFLGIYGERLHKDLHTIRTIRNDFAHKRKGISFETQGIRDRCSNLTVMDNFRHPDRPEYFHGGGHTVSEALMSPPRGPVPREPRAIYVTSVKLLLGYLALATAEPLPEPKFP